MLYIFVWALPVVLYFVRQAIGLGGDLNEPHWAVPDLGRWSFNAMTRKDHGEHHYDEDASRPSSCFILTQF